MLCLIVPIYIFVVLQCFVFYLYWLTSFIVKCFVEGSARCCRNIPLFTMMIMMLMILMMFVFDLRCRSKAGKRHGKGNAVQGRKEESAIFKVVSGQNPLLPERLIKKMLKTLIPFSTCDFLTYGSFCCGLVLCDKLCL